MLFKGTKTNLSDKEHDLVDWLVLKGEHGLDLLLGHEGTIRVEVSVQVLKHLPFSLVGFFFEISIQWVAEVFLIQVLKSSRTCHLLFKP